MTDLKDEVVQELIPQGGPQELDEESDVARISATTELAPPEPGRWFATSFRVPADERVQIGEFLAPPPFPQSLSLSRRWRKAGACLLLVLGLTVGDLSRDLAFNAIEKTARERLDAARQDVQFYRYRRAARWQRALQAIAITAAPRVFVGETWVVRIYNAGQQQQRLVSASWQDAAAQAYLPPGRTARMTRTFSRAGWHTLTYSLNNSYQHRQSVRVYVRKPIRPGKYPVRLPPGIALTRNPKDWHLVLNIYNDEQQPEQNTIFFRGEVIQRFLISTGLEGHPTPIGRWWVVEKRPEPWSTLYHVPMPYWSGLANGWSSGLFGLHTLTDAYFQNYLGGPASHGCIRHAPQAAMWLYENVPIGTTVDIIARKER